jgi:hypothetical protein
MRPMVTSGSFAIVKVTAYDFYAQGGKIYGLGSRKPITPEQSRENALDKHAWDQNYGCQFADELGALLTAALIDNAEDPGVGKISQGDWTPTALDRLRHAQGDLFVGVDVGRTRDLTVISVGELVNGTLLIRGMLRLQNMRLPQQQERLEQALVLPKFRACRIDMTGLGLGLCEYTQQKHGLHRVRGVDFRSTVPLSDPRAKPILEEGRQRETVSITEVMAVALMQRYEGRRIKHIPDVELRDDLLKPERIVTPSGKVSVAAVRSLEDHADHFWSLALCNEAIGTNTGGLTVEDIHFMARVNRPRLLLGEPYPFLRPEDF